jgi:hypothetical protein
LKRERVLLIVHEIGTCASVRPIPQVYSLDLCFV